MKLVRLISRELRCGSKTARAYLASGAVVVNGAAEQKQDRLIAPFDRVSIGDTVLLARTPRYVALHKPSGVVSATTDRQHPTVTGLIDRSWAEELHLAGRLDRFTTGLVILTNDSRYSEFLTLPEKRVPKTYLVETETDVPDAVLDVFRAGLRLEKENITTAPALAERLGGRRVRLTIYEGKHHQIKRMFARFGIRVTALHRESIGSLHLGDIPPGGWHEFVPVERPDY